MLGGGILQHCFVLINDKSKCPMVPHKSRKGLQRKAVTPPDIYSAQRQNRTAETGVVGRFMPIWTRFPAQIYYQ